MLLLVFLWHVLSFIHCCQLSVPFNTHICVHKWRGQSVINTCREGHTLSGDCLFVFQHLYSVGGILYITDCKVHRHTNCDFTWFYSTFMAQLFHVMSLTALYSLYRKQLNMEIRAEVLRLKKIILVCSM